MSEEEKKAIERLDRLTIGTIIQTTDIDNASLILYDKIILLNLIEKQQKEIETLQADLHDMTLSNNHKKQKWIHKDCLNSYVSKQVIRDKIKEIEEKDKEYKTRMSDGRETFIVECLSIPILKELLGE